MEKVQVRLLLTLRSARVVAIVNANANVMVTSSLKIGTSIIQLMG